MRILCIALLFFCSTVAYGQQEHLSFKHIGVAEGLPESSVNVIKQDKSGFIWLATQNGAVRYDGYQAKVYRFGLSDKRNHPTCNVQGLYIDKKGTVWFSTDKNGIFKYDAAVDSVIQFRPASAKKNKPIEQFINNEDRQGGLWSAENLAGRGERTLQRLDPANGKFIAFGKSVKGPHHIDARVTYVSLVSIPSLKYRYSSPEIWNKLNRRILVKSHFFHGVI